MKNQLLRLSKKAVTYGIGNVLNRFISFLLLPLFTKYLTPSDYGISSILGWMAFLITSIFSLGIGTSMAPCYFEKGNSTQKQSTVWSAFMILLVSAFVLLMIGIPFSKLWSNLAFHTVDHNYLVIITFISTSLSILSIPLTLYLQFEEKARLYAIFTIITTIISVGLNVLFVVIFRRGIRGVIESNLITQIVNLVLFLWPALLRLDFRIQIESIRELLRLGLPLIPSSAFMFILQQGNRYILQMFSGLDEVGIYTIGYNFGMVMSIPVEALSVAWVPFFMSYIDHREEAKKLFGRLVTFYFLGFGSLSLLFYILARPVVMLMTQPAFHEAYRVVGLSSTAYFLMGLFSLLLPGMYFAKEVKYVGVIQGLAAVLSIAANLLFIPGLRVLGAGLGLMFGYLCMVVLTLLWNWLRKFTYLQIAYEWKRLLTWLIIYVTYATGTLWNWHFSLMGESIYSLVLIIFLPLILLGMLNAWERQNIFHFLKQLFPGSLLSLPRRRE